MNIHTTEMDDLYRLCGNSGDDIRTLCIYFAMADLCDHNDLAAFDCMSVTKVFDS